MKSVFTLASCLLFILLTSCASRGWQLSEQIEGVDNKLESIKIYEKGTSKRHYSMRSTSSEQENLVFKNRKLKFKGKLTKTTFGESGLLLISE